MDLPSPNKTELFPFFCVSYYVFCNIIFFCKMSSIDANMYSSHETGFKLILSWKKACVTSFYLVIEKVMDNFWK